MDKRELVKLATELMEGFLIMAHDAKEAETFQIGGAWEDLAMDVIKIRSKISSADDV